MNITTLILAAAAAVSVNTQAERSDVAQPLQPVIEVWNGSIAQVMDVEDYVAACVMHEMPYTFHGEALKAQAVAARTYLYYCIQNGYVSHPYGDVCTDPSHCMGYITYDEYVSRYGSDAARRAKEAAKTAADSTSGEVMMYNGEFILSVWHSSSEGMTEDCGAVWLTSLPYLKPVYTPEESALTRATFTLAEVRRILEKAGYAADNLTDIQIKRTPSGRCASLRLGTLTVSGNEARWLFSLRSTDFDAKISGGKLNFTVRGYGHGVGLSQYGADAMAKNGADYESILEHYYSKAELTG